MQRRDINFCFFFFKFIIYKVYETEVLNMAIFNTTASYRFRSVQKLLF